MKERIAIGLVEDQVLFRNGIKAILGGWDELEVIFESGDGYSVIDRNIRGRCRTDRRVFVMWRMHVVVCDLN